MLQLHITNGNCSPPIRAVRVPQKPSRATPLVGFCSTTFFCARKMLTHFPYRAQKNVSYLER